MPAAAHEFFHASQWMYQRPCPTFGTLQVTWAWFFNEDLRSRRLDAVVVRTTDSRVDHKM